MKISLELVGEDSLERKIIRDTQDDIINRLKPLKDEIESFGGNYEIKKGDNEIEISIQTDRENILDRVKSVFDE
jgi:hypothetical protein